MMVKGAGGGSFFYYELHARWLGTAGLERIKRTQKAGESGRIMSRNMQRRAIAERHHDGLGSLSCVLSVEALYKMAVREDIGLSN